jgi:ribose transport system ATP-binding protein
VGPAPSATVAALRLWDLSKTFGGQKALDNASLEIAPGEVHGLLGQNGCGKSTLIKILAGFHAPDPGSRLEIGGAEVALPLAPGEFRKHRMSFVHQHLGLIPSLTALENLLLGRLAESEAWAINWSAKRRAARTLFASYDMISILTRASPTSRRSSAHCLRLSARSRR